MKLSLFKYDSPTSNLHGAFFAIVPEGHHWEELILRPGATEWEPFPGGYAYEWGVLEANPAMVPADEPDLPVPLPTTKENR